jgi:hypothetical protein
VAEVENQEILGVLQFGWYLAKLVVTQVDDREVIEVEQP